MPYIVVHRDNKYRVYKRSADGRAEGRALGVHDTRRAAYAQRAALFAAENKRRNAATATGTAAKGVSTGGGLWAAVRPHFTTKYRKGDLVYVRSAGARGEIVSVTHTKVGVVYAVKLDLGGIVICKTKDLQRVATRAAKLELNVPEALRDAILRSAERIAAQGDGSQPSPAQTADERTAKADGEVPESMSVDEPETPSEDAGNLRDALVKAMGWAILADDAQTVVALAKHIPAKNANEQAALEYVIAKAQNDADWSDTAMLLYERGFGALDALRYASR
jgi:hypothetical protein